MARAPTVLVDTNAIIEAVRTRCWNAITGGMTVETVSTCCGEALAGDSTSGYVRVTKADLTRLSAEHTVTEAERAAFYLEYEPGDGMDEGERDLFAHLLGRTDADVLICSPDKASVRAAVTLGWGDRLVALSDLLERVGCKAAPPIEPHYRTAWLASCKTRVRLGSL